MGQKRIRRFVTTTPALTSCRDFNYADKTEFDDTKADLEGAGYPVRMTDGPYDVTLKCQSDETVSDTGYVPTYVAVVDEVDVSSGTEVIVKKTYTFENGYFVKDLSVPTDGPGEVALKGTFRTMVAT